MHISVRDLVEFILRSGDIDNRKETGADPEAMQEGTRIHQKIQKSMPYGYEAEVTLAEQFTEDDLTLTVEGRADGIWHKREEDGIRIIIDEIKSMYANLSYVEKPKDIHLSQAKCYAAMYSRQECLDEIGIQITYCDIDTEEIRRFHFTFQQQELRQWFTELVSRYMVWAREDMAHKAERTRTASELEFPFAYRKGQKETARDVYRAVKRSRKLFIQAPTGSGKTLSTLYPSVKAMAEGLCDRIFYLTARTVTASAALNAAGLLRDRGLCIRMIHITAKEKACLNSTFDCNPDACPYAEGHFDRVNDAVFDVITHEDIITREIIRSYAEKYSVCPYELSLDVSSWCDIIAGDYNYAFDPRVKLKRFFASAVINPYILLVDEAHNLVSRAQKMYSAELIKEDVLACARMVKGMDKKLSGALNLLNRKLLALKKENGESYRVCGDLDELGNAAGMTVFALSAFLEKYRFFDLRKEVLDFYFQVKRFSDVFQGDLSGYVPYTRMEEDGRFAAKLLCVDPSVNLSEITDCVRSTVLFSATLLPMTYYKELLTGSTEDYAIYADTVFTQDQRLLVSVSDVSSRYTRRNAAEYQKIALCIQNIIKARKGNYLVFFPSYDFMRNVREYMGETDILMQSSRMSEAEREAFLESFADPSEHPCTGFCVMGGIFAEGIDLKDDRLIGAIVVGTGLPMINPESEIEKEYYDSHGKDGYAYAYRYPGMNKVMQAAGRVIRTETDRGVIFLLDERFSSRDHRSLFPREWSDIRSIPSGQVQAILTAFYET